MTTYSTYDPTSLFAGEPPVRQRAITLAAGQNAAGVPLPRGTLLGRSTNGAPPRPSNRPGPNTGTGTLTPDATTPVLAAGQNGTYQVVFTAATAYTVTDPFGAQVGTGAVGTAFANQIKFNTAAGGTAFVAGDGFAITVEAQDDYAVCKVTATDGSQTPVAVLAYAADTSAGAVQAPAYFEGEFAGEIMTIDTSWTIQGAAEGPAHRRFVPLRPLGRRSRLICIPST